MKTLSLYSTNPQFLKREQAREEANRDLDDFIHIAMKSGYHIQHGYIYEELIENSHRYCWVADLEATKD